MELHIARQIIDTLSQGIHPISGEMMPADSPYNAPPVIRALFAVSQALSDKGDKSEKPVRAPRQQPPNAGKAWDAAEDTRLEAAFAAGQELKQLAEEMGRTLFAVESRLVKLGKLPPRPGMRV